MDCRGVFRNKFILFVTHALNNRTIVGIERDVGFPNCSFVGARFDVPLPDSIYVIIPCAAIAFLFCYRPLTWFFEHPSLPPSYEGGKPKAGGLLYSPPDCTPIVFRNIAWQITDIHFHRGSPLINLLSYYRRSTSSPQNSLYTQPSFPVMPYSAWSSNLCIYLF